MSLIIGAQSDVDGTGAGHNALSFFFQKPAKTSEKSILMIRILKLPPEWAIPTPRMKIPGQTDTSLKAAEHILRIMSSLSL